MRKASIERNTKETSIAVEVNLDGQGNYNIETGIGFLDHMLEQLSRHSLIDITVKTANGRITCAEALGHKEFVITKLYRSA